MTNEAKIKEVAIQLTNLDGTPGEEKIIKNLINLCDNLPYPNNQNSASFLGTPIENSGNNKCDVLTILFTL